MELEQAYSRLEAGEPPNEQAEREWEREVKEERRRRVEAYTRKKVGTMVVWGQIPLLPCTLYSAVFSPEFLGRRAQIISVTTPLIFGKGLARTLYSV